MELSRTRFAYETISAFLAGAGPDPLIENFCVQYLVVCFYSEVESMLGRIIRERLQNIQDEKVAAFVAATNDAMIRRVKKSEINDILKKFGCEDAVMILDEIGGVNLEPYFSAIANRHLVSHGDGCEMTLEEFGKAIPCAELIFSAVQTALAP